MRPLLKDTRGQMTVELAVVFPVLIAVAFIAMNALQFFGLCSSFDRTAHAFMRTVAASPAYGQDAETVRSLIEDGLFHHYEDRAEIQVSVAYRGVAPDLDRFTAEMTYHPTLFGLGLRTEVMGVALPPLVHRTQLTLDRYKPGVFL